MNDVQNAQVPTTLTMLRGGSVATEQEKVRPEVEKLAWATPEATTAIEHTGTICCASGKAAAAIYRYLIRSRNLQVIGYLEHVVSSAIKHICRVLLLQRGTDFGEAVNNRQQFSAKLRQGIFHAGGIGGQVFSGDHLPFYKIR